MPKGPASGWTDAEKVQLLFAFIQQNGGIKWTNFTPPPGRTQKACMHMIAKLKEQAKVEESGVGENEKSDTVIVDTGKGLGKSRVKEDAVGKVKVEAIGATGNKRKAGEMEGDGADGHTSEAASVKKRGRPKKVIAEPTVKVEAVEAV